MVIQTYYNLHDKAFETPYFYELGTYNVNRLEIIGIEV